MGHRQVGVSWWFSSVSQKRTKIPALRSETMGLIQKSLPSGPLLSFPTLIEYLPCDSY